MRDHDYAIGVDTATGEGSDFSVATVIDLQTAEIAAVIRMKADYAAFTMQLHFLAEWYNHALIAVEDQGGYGKVVIAYLRDGHEGRKSYINLYRHKEYDDRKKKLKVKYGFPMGAASRAKVVAELARWINGKQLPWLPRRAVIESRTFVRQPTRPSPRHADGSHDDAVMSLGIALEVYDSRGEHKHDVKKKNLKPADPAERTKDRRPVGAADPRRAT